MAKQSYASLVRDHNAAVATNAHLRETLTHAQNNADTLQARLNDALVNQQNLAQSLNNLNIEVAVAHELLNGKGLPDSRHDGTTKLTLIQRIAAI